MALWLSNSFYSFLGVFLKIYQFFKDRAKAKRVQDFNKNEKGTNKNEKDIIITNLEV